MKLLWEDRAWSDYLYWQTQDKKKLNRLKAKRNRPVHRCPRLCLQR